MLRFASQSTGKSIAPFKVSVTRSDHPMTANLRDFRVEEELYLVHRTAVLDLLLHTSFTGTCPDSARNRGTIRRFPCCTSIVSAKSKSSIFTLGHCCGHYDLQSVAI